MSAIPKIVPALKALTVAAFCAALTLSAPASADKVDAEELVTEAGYTLRKLQNHPDLGKWVKTYLKRAKAVIIVPQLLKGGFIVGGEGGTGVLLARGEGGQWSYPAFFSMGSASFGLQFGGQSSEMLLLIMTGNGLRSILDDQVKIGGELDGAAGPYGAGLDASTTTNMNVDVLSYSVAQGVYIGANIEGTVIFPRESLNEDYYGRLIGAEDVVLNGAVANPQADDLRQALSEALR